MNRKREAAAAGAWRHPAWSGVCYSALQASVAGPWLLLPTLVWTFGHLDSPGPATVERLSRCSHDHDLTACGHSNMWSWGH